jgi:hypothetical protein
MFKTKLDEANTRHRLFVYTVNLEIKSVALAGLLEYLTRTENTWRCRWLDTCLNDQEYELCIFFLTDYFFIIYTCIYTRDDPG